MQEVAQSASSCCAPESRESAVQFPTDRRVHISLNVKSVQRSLPFYKALFNQNPTKFRPDYAKFEVVEPAVNFTLNEHPDATDRDGHFGVEVGTTEAVSDAYNRLRGLGIPIEATETEVACCYSVQDKIWASDPDGNRWEIFVVTASEADEGCGATCICFDPETGRCKWD